MEIRNLYIIKTLELLEHSSDSKSVMHYNTDRFAKQKVTLCDAECFRVGNGPASVAVGYFDGDSDLNLAVSNSGDGTVSILLGNGNGTFGTATNFDVGFGPASVAVGEFNTS